tara:strand:- start:200 stop:1294 length:1095 start_codon:yes stop_codon:yes gene_type:complete
MKDNCKKQLIAFIYSSGRRKRILNKCSKFPSEFFYGYIELLQAGYDVRLFEENELGFRLKNKFLNSILILLSKIFLNIPLNMFLGFLFSGGYRKLCKYKTIVATSNGVGMCLAISKSLGLLKNKIIFINMGLFAKKQGLIKTYFYKKILQNIKMLSLSKFETKFLSNEFDSKNVYYLPFGVDMSFWKKNNLNKNNSYILSIGGDLARDWNLLINSWQSDFPLLKIVSPNKINTSKNNIEIVSSDWKEEKLSDIEIKEIILNSLFVIIPLKETIQPSGQSSCLQAMACGKAVLISDITGIWDRNLLVNKENLLLVKPSDKDSLINGVKILIKDNALRTKLEINGRKLIEEKLNSLKMVDDLKHFL